MNTRIDHSDCRTHFKIVIVALFGATIAFFAAANSTHTYPLHDRYEQTHALVSVQIGGGLTVTK